MMPLLSPFTTCMLSLLFRQMKWQMWRSRDCSGLFLYPRLNHTGSHRSIDSHSKPYLHPVKKGQNIKYRGKKRLNRALRQFQQYFSHITATVHIIHVFPKLHQYNDGALKCLAQGNSHEKSPADPVRFKPRTPGYESNTSPLSQEGPLGKKIWEDTISFVRYHTISSLTRW